MLFSASVVLLVGTVFNTFASIESESEPAWDILKEPAWDILKVNWPTSTSMPLTAKNAEDADFVQLDGDCSDGKFLGRRYMVNNDIAVVLIYDVNGYIAGIQNGIPKSETDKVKTSSFSFEKSPAYQLDNIHGKGEVYFLTVYFVDLNIICNGGRTEEQFLKNTIGTELHLQNGTNPIRDSVVVPLYQNDTAGTLWVKGPCFASIGVQYWYNMHENMPCDDFFPISATYNKGKLAGITFASFGNYLFSRRFEHPPISALRLMLPTPLPKCFNDEAHSSGGFSMIHVFFNSKPWNKLCLKIFEKQLDTK